MLTHSFGIGAHVAQPPCPPVGRTRPVANSHAYRRLTRCVRARSLSTIRIRRFSSTARLAVEPDQEDSGSDSRGKKSASIILFIFFPSDVFLLCTLLTCQPGDKPRSQKSND